MYFLNLGVKGLNGWENVLFELGSERNRHIHYTQYNIIRITRESRTSYVNVNWGGEGWCGCEPRAEELLLG